MEKATRAPIVEVDSNEEAEMDIPPTLPNNAPSPPPHMSLDIQQLQQDPQDDIRILSEE